MPDDKKVPPARDFPKPRDPPLKTTEELSADLLKRILTNIVKRAQRCH